MQALSLQSAMQALSAEPGAQARRTEVAVG